MDGFPILSLVTYIPLITAIVLIVNPKWASSQIKLIAAGGAGINLLLSLVMLPLYNYSPQVDTSAGMPAMQFQENFPWLGEIGINYHMGVDGVSMLLVRMTSSMLTPSTPMW